ncbi:unnamed protein product [Coffea canephora]|uniref:Mitochondrial import receptor subunit TOM9-2-like n=1 Tax=Coffea canephora TaxID=49390 RepID=A0A068TSP4_COFCA|nr:unnamed protein product [Coffea canephora]
MASFGGKRAPANRSRPDRRAVLSARASSESSSIVDKGKRAACNAAYVGKKLLNSTGKATWYLATTLLIFVVPLLITMDREQQLENFELQNQALLGPAPPPQQVHGPPM